MSYKFVQRLSELIKSRSSNLPKNESEYPRYISDDALFRTTLNKIVGINGELLKLNYECKIVDVSSNYSYFIVLIKSEMELIDDFLESDNLEDEDKSKILQIFSGTNKYGNMIIAVIFGRRKPDGSTGETKKRMIDSLKAKDFELAAIIIKGRASYFKDKENAAINRIIESFKNNRTEDVRIVISSAEFKALNLFTPAEITTIQKLIPPSRDILDILSPKPNTKIQNGSVIDLNAKYEGPDVENTEFIWDIIQIIEPDKTKPEHRQSTGRESQTTSRASSSQSAQSQRNLPQEFSQYFENEIDDVVRLIDEWNNLRQGKGSFAAFNSKGTRFGSRNADDISSNQDAHPNWSVIHDGMGTIIKIGSYYLVFLRAELINITSSVRLTLTCFYYGSESRKDGRIVSLAYPAIFGDGPGGNSTEDSKFHCLLKGKIVVE